MAVDFYLETSRASLTREGGSESLVMSLEVW